MSSRSPWHIYLAKKKDGEEIDWYTCNPGPVMREVLGSWFGPRIEYRIELVIEHLPSGHVARATIIKDRRRYQAKYKRELLTLEATAKMMKEELRLHGR